MSKIRIVTDSTADLPRELIEKYNIVVVPLKVMFGQEIYRDGVDLTSHQFFQKLRASSTLPTTSQPSPQEFLEAYQPLVEERASIISIHISSSLSGTIQSAKLAKSMLGYEDLEIIDSRLVSLALGLVVLVAAQKAAEGFSKEEVREAARQAMNNIQAYFLVDTLEYLQRGGRIGKAQAFLGTLLNVKPICTLKEGIIYPYEKVRGKLKAMERLVEIIAEKFPPGSPLWCALAHGDDFEGVEQLKERLTKRFTIKQLIIGEIGSVVGTHAGPGLLGIIVCPVRGVS